MNAYNMPFWWIYLHLELCLVDKIIISTLVGTTSTIVGRDEFFYLGGDNFYHCRWG